MSIIATANILNILSGYNHWWKVKRVQKEYLKPVRRTGFKSAMSLIFSEKCPRTIYIIGPHRTGKSAVLHQMIDEMIERGIAPKRLIYLNVGHPFFNIISFEEIYTVYRENVNLTNNEKTYCFFDDVQLSPEWEKNILKLKNTFPEITIIASGTILPSVVPDDSVVLHFPSMSFYEYCQIDAKVEDVGQSVVVPEKGIINASPYELRALAKSIAPFRPQFARYLYTGGFPKLVMHTDDVLVQRMIQDGVLNDTLLRDIPACYNIRAGEELAKVFLYLCTECPGIISYEVLAKSVDNITRPTVGKYINYLANSNLIYLSYPVNGENGPIKKIQPKIYLADAAFLSALLVLDDIQIQHYINKIVETTVYRHLRFYGSDFSEAKIEYLRGQGNKKGLDMIFTGSKKIHVDIRYDGSQKLSNKDPIISMSNKADICFIVTRDDNAFGRIPGAPQNVFQIPAHILLFLISQAKNQNHSFLSGM